LTSGESAGYEVLLNLAGAYDKLALEAGAGTQTVEDRERFREYRDKVIEYYFRAGQLAVEAKDPRAEAILQRVLRYDPRNPRVLPLLGRLSRQAGSNVRAIHHYKEYMKTPEGEGDFAARVELGRLLVSEQL